VLIFAHRGASAAHPENTVEAFRAAVAMGADGVELDVRRAPDGRLGVRHDPYPDGATAVLSLDDALDACGDLVVNIEIKHLPSDGGWDPSMAIVRETLATLHARGGATRSQWLISSFSWATIAASRQIDPEIGTAFLTVAPSDDVVDRVAAAGHLAIHPWEGLVDGPLVERAHRAGLMVNAWTCNDPERLRALVELAVDGVCTDVPDVAAASLGR
jgi:glycerophosphoryl diester phosphodiesterase